MPFSVSGGVVLVLGASRGLGLEFLRQIKAKAPAVLIATVRDPSSAPEAAELADHVLKLDVSSEASIAEFAAELKKTASHVDIAINNAGIYTRGGLDSVTQADLVADFVTNTAGPLLVAKALVDAGVVGGDRPSLLAIMSSKMGSIDDNGSGGSYAYRCSKAAVNAAAKSLSVDLAPSAVTVTVLHPGFVRTDMTGGRGLIDTNESISGLLSVIESDRDLNGKFTAFDGKAIPW